MPRDSWRIIARDLVPPRSVFVFSDEEGSWRCSATNKDGARNFGTFRDPVSLCSQKFDRVEGLLSRERVEVDEI